jgi:hypothetical protein
MTLSELLKICKTNKTLCISASVIIVSALVILFAKIDSFQVAIETARKIVIGRADRDLPSNRVIRVQDFLIEPTGCKIDEENVLKCEVSFTSEEGDRKLWVLGNSSVITGSGGSYRLSKAKIGNTSKELISESDSITEILASDMATQVVLSFNGVQEQVKKIQSLRLTCYKDTQDIQNEFRLIILDIEFQP